MVSESKPRSLNAWSGLDAPSASVWPRTAADLGAYQVQDERGRAAGGSPDEAPAQAGSRSAGWPVSRRAAWPRRDLGQVGEQRAGRGAREQRAKRVQSMSATVSGRVAVLDRLPQRGEREVAAPSARSRRGAGGPATPGPSAMPASAQGPQAIEVAGRPRARRCSASASRKALAAA